MRKSKKARKYFLLIIRVGKCRIKESKVYKVKSKKLLNS